MARASPLMPPVTLTKELYDWVEKTRQEIKPMPLNRSQFVRWALQTLKEKLDAEKAERTDIG